MWFYMYHQLGCWSHYFRFRKAKPIIYLASLWLLTFDLSYRPCPLPYKPYTASEVTELYRCSLTAGHFYLAQMQANGEADDDGFQAFFHKIHLFWLPLWWTWYITYQSTRKKWGFVTVYTKLSYYMYMQYFPDIGIIYKADHRIGFL